MSGEAFAPGAVDLEARAAVLAHELTDGLKPLARVAYNYRWSWTREGEDVFRDIHRAPLGALGREPGALPRRSLALDAGRRRAEPRS